MNQFRRPGPDGVNPKNLPILLVNEQLEHPIGIAKKLPARKLAILSNPRLVRNPGRGELILRPSNHRNLGNRINAVRK